MTLSRETLEVCMGLVSQVTLAGGDPNLEANAAQVLRVRAELAEALRHPPDEGVSP